MATPERFYAAACQIDFPAAETRNEIGYRVDRMCEIIEQTVTGYEPFFDVRLLTFPEFAHAIPVYPTAKELLEKLAIEIPNEHTERYQNLAKNWVVISRPVLSSRRMRLTLGMYSIPQS